MSGQPALPSLLPAWLPTTSKPNSHSIDKDLSIPASEGQNTTHDTKRKKGLLEIEEKDSELMLDHQKLPRAHNVDEGRSSDDTAGDPAAFPAGQVKVPTVDTQPARKQSLSQEINR